MQTRRNFFGGMFAAAGAVTLVGCIDQDEPEWTGIVAPQPVALQPGMRHANVLPTSIPRVRLYRAAITP